MDDLACVKLVGRYVRLRPADMFSGFMGAAFTDANNFFSRPQYVTVSDSLSTSRATTRILALA